MKIRVNYDLLDKINESKTGISINRTNTKHFLVVGLASLLNLPNIILSSNRVATLITYLTIINLISSLHRGIENKESKNNNIELSINDLKMLSKLLRSYNVNTDYELLQNSYSYKTKYSLMFDDNKIPRLKQEKYIMVPVVDIDEEKEVSLVQEHLFGSVNYELSYGSLSETKVLKPVFNGI